jgi:glycosyltransferase involved in cell wall biosynthesis
MPVHQAAYYLPVTLERLEPLDPQPDLYLFAENNSTDRTLALVNGFRERHELIRVWFRDDAVPALVRGGGTFFDIVGIMRQLLLQRARQLDLDYAIFIDSDVWPVSRELVRELCSSNGFDIVGGPVYRYYPQGMRLSALWWAPPGSRHRFQLRMLPTTGKLLEEVAAVGGGCMRLNRRVIEDRRLNFYPVRRDWLQAGEVSEDFGYCLEAQALGYSVGLDTTLELNHYSPPDLVARKQWTVDAKGAPVPFVFPS